MHKKQINDELGLKNKLTSTPIRMYTLICIVGLLTISIVGYGFFKADRMVKAYAPLIDATMEIKLEITTAHLWFEEIISGDRNEDISKVWKHQDQAAWYVNAMLEGGKNSEGTFIPLDDAELCSKIKDVQDKLKEFGKITQKRLETKELSGVGSDIDQKYDTIFQSVLKDADEVETELQQIITNDLNSFRYTQVLLIIITILLFLIIGISFWYFDNKRLKNLLLLSQANRSLRKSEDDLSIADTGKGMDKELIQKIFDPFFTTKEKGKGTGMGLSVVYGIVTSMNGAVKVYSEPDKGTEFYVYLPVEKSPSEEQATHSKTEIQGGTEQILLVDDEEAILTIEKKMLERLGYHVTSRTSSIDALEAFRANPDKFDMVITDMAMPNLSGDRLSFELIKIRSDIPILLCTGFNITMSEEKAATMGINDFLIKPIMMKDLSQKIREVLDKIKD